MNDYGGSQGDPPEALEKGPTEEKPMGETLGLTTNYSRQARHTAPASLRTQDDHAAIVGHTGPLTPPAVILSGALAKLNLFEGRARRVEPVTGTTCGLLV
jgi:hypothetical protein